MSLVFNEFLRYLFVWIGLMNFKVSFGDFNIPIIVIEGIIFLRMILMSRGRWYIWVLYFNKAIIEFVIRFFLFLR